MNADQTLRRAWWAVVARFLIHGLAISTWVSRIPSIKSGLNLNDGVFGICLLGTAVGSVIGIPICGYMVTRHGSRRAATVTSVALCAALLLPALAGNAWLLFAALFCFGFFAGSNDVAMNAQGVAIERLLGEPTMSRFHAMFSIGGMAGAALGGIIASRGVPAIWHLPIAGTVIGLFALLTGPALMETRPDQAPGFSRLRYRQIPPALLLICAIGFCILLSEGAIADWTAIYLKQVLRAGPGIAAAGYAVFSAAMSIFRLAGDRITLKLGPVWTIRGGAALAAIGLTTSVLAPSAIWALPGFFLAGAGFSSIIPLVFAAGGRIPNLGEGAGVATVSGLGYLAFLIGPPAIGMISQVTSLRFGLSLLIVLSAAASVMVSEVDRRGVFSRPEAAKPLPESTPLLQ